MRLAAVVFLVLLPLLVHSPLWLFGLSAGPLPFTADLIETAPRQILPGVPGWVDPNAGITTQAIGGYAAREWLHGRVPWWNPFSGVGVPLAAEMQPAALFLPFSLLLALPDGVLLNKMALQALGGVAAFVLLGALNIAPPVALVGAALLELCGTFAWFSHAPINPLPFLPLLLLGIERCAAAAEAREPGGWAWVAVALAASLYAGFPETAYLDGLLALAWALWRVAGSRQWFATARKILLGGGVGLLLAAPILLLFVQELRSSYVGAHAVLGEVALTPACWAVVLVPYLSGPLGLCAPLSVAGTYIGLPLLFLALLALLRQAGPPGLRWVLAGFSALALAKTAQLPVVSPMLDALPFIGQTAVYLYVGPALVMALIVLACLALDAFRRAPAAPWVGACAAALVLLALAGALRLAPQPLDDLLHWRGVAGIYGAIALAVALVVLVLVALLLWLAPVPRGVALGGAVLVAYAAAVFALPLLSGTRKVPLDRAAIGFLQANLGLSRFYTLGPFQPNWGAWFGVASINHNMLPVPRRWVDYVRANLDPLADDVSFSGDWPPPAPGRESRAEALAHRLAAYQQVGVRYVLAPSGAPPFGPVPRVLHDTVMDIYELPSPAPYFEAPGCSLVATGRQAVAADCPAPARLLRREMFDPGWFAEVNGTRIDVAEDGTLFQSVALPAGHSAIGFAYAPPGIAWAGAAALLGLAVLLVGWLRAVWRPRRAG